MGHAPFSEANKYAPQKHMILLSKEYHPIEIQSDLFIPESQYKNFGVGLDILKVRNYRKSFFFETIC